MIRHIVMWKLKQENMEENKKEIKSRLEALPDKIDVIASLHVYFNCQQASDCFDVCLIADFHSLKELSAYQIHPDHVCVSKFIRSVIETRSAIDFEIEK